MMVQAEGGSSDQLALLLCHIARLASLLVVYEHLAASRACCQAEFARLLGHKKKVIAAIMIQTSIPGHASFSRVQNAESASPTISAIWF